MATDNFNRPDNTILGESWIELPADAGMSILSNRLLIDNPTIGGDSDRHARWDFGSDLADQSSEATITDLDSNSFGSIAVRINFDAVSQRWEFVAFARVDLLNGTESQRIIFRSDPSQIIASVTISLASGLAWAIGRKVKITAVGNTYRTYVNGQETMSATDVRTPLGLPGFGNPGGIGGSNTGFDDWEGGGLEAIPYIRSKRRLRLIQRHPHKFKHYIDPWES